MGYATVPTNRKIWMGWCDWEGELGWVYSSAGYESLVGYMLEVDQEYPDELHDSHDNFPCAPERMVIKKEYLSDTQKWMGEQVGERY